MFVAFNCKNGNCQNWFFEREEICKKFEGECYKNSTGQQKNKLGDFQYTRKARWTKKVCFFLHNAYFREDTFRVSDTIIGIQNEVRTIVLLSRISCY